MTLSDKLLSVSLTKSIKSVADLADALTAAKDEDKADDPADPWFCDRGSQSGSFDLSDPAVRNTRFAAFRYFVVDTHDGDRGILTDIPLHVWYHALAHALDNCMSAQTLYEAHSWRRVWDALPDHYRQLNDAALDDVGARKEFALTMLVGTNLPPLLDGFGNPLDY